MQENINEDVKLIRKRYIPNEEIDISKDEIVHLDDELLITSWKPIHARDDMKKGMSYTYLKKGWKVSKVYANDNELAYYYCDIIDMHIDKKRKIYETIDLLVDIIVYPNGKIKVVDLDELAEAEENGLIRRVQLEMALRRANELLNLMYEDKFPFQEMDEIK